MKLGTLNRAALTLAGAMAAAAALAQTGGQAEGQGTGNLDIPRDARFIGNADPNVRKATAIVNGTVITKTEVDHRVALVVIASGGRVSDAEMVRLREQLLRNLVDEVLQIQAAEAEEIKVEQSEIDNAFGRYARNFNQTPEQFAVFLRSRGSSDTTIKRQIHAELAWNRLTQKRIAPFVNVSEEEIESVLKTLEANRGSQEYKVSEIFLAATPENATEVRANAQRIVEQLKQGASFPAYARQFSEASTAAVGGDLSWVKAEQLPEAMAAVVRQMPVGSLSEPIAIPGGYSIVAVEDTRQVLTADPRNAVLSLKQISINFAPGTTREQAESRTQELVRTTQTMGGCGGAEAAAAALGGEVISNDQVTARDLPGPLQEVLLNLGVGQSTAPFGSVNERISVLVLCGRDDPDPSQQASREGVYNSIMDTRVNLRARRYLRDLRRDAVVDYR